MNPAQIDRANAKAFITAYVIAHGRGPSYDAIAEALRLPRAKNARDIVRWLIANRHAARRGRIGLHALTPTFANPAPLLPDVRPPALLPHRPRNYVRDFAA